MTNNMKTLHWRGSSIKPGRGGEWQISKLRAHLLHWNIKYKWWWWWWRWWRWLFTFAVVIVLVLMLCLGGFGDGRFFNWTKWDLWGRTEQSPFHHARLLLEVPPGRLLHLLVAQHPHPVLNNHLAELHRGSSFNLSFLLFSVQCSETESKTG